jgi:hypothetical protein
MSVSRLMRARRKWSTAKLTLLCLCDRAVQLQTQSTTNIVSDLGIGMGFPGWQAEFLAGHKSEPERSPSSSGLPDPG